MDQPTNGKPGFSYLSERYGRYYDPKKYKSIHNLRLKKIKIGSPFVCTCGSNKSSKFQIKKLKIERGIAEMPFSPFFVENT